MHRRVFSLRFQLYVRCKLDAATFGSFVFIESDWTVTFEIDSIRNWSSTYAGRLSEIIIDLKNWEQIFLLWSDSGIFRKTAAFWYCAHTKDIKVSGVYIIYFIPSPNMLVKCWVSKYFSDMFRYLLNKNSNIVLIGYISKLVHTLFKNNIN